MKVSHWLRLVILFFAGILAPTALHAQHTVTLGNGDQLTGRLKSIENARWVFAYQGQDVTLAVADVSSFASPQPIGVRLTDGTIGAGRVEETPTGLRLTLLDGPRIITPQQLAAIGDPDDLAALVPVHITFLSPFTRFWTANVSLGFSDKSGNSRSRGLAGTLDIERRTRKDRLTIGIGGNREQSQAIDGAFETTVSKVYGSLRLDVFVNGRFFVFGAIKQERDRFQDIALRSTYNGGFGFQAFASDRSDINFSLASGARREIFISAGSETATVAALASTLRHDFGPAVLLWKLDFSPELKDPGNFRLVSDAGVTAPLFLGIGFRLGVLDEYNSRPQPGIKSNDLLVTTRLSYTIGR